VLVATPRDYASCHEMKRDERTRVQGDLFQSILKAFPYFGSEVRSARTRASCDGGFAVCGCWCLGPGILSSHPDQSCHRSGRRTPCLLEPPPQSPCSPALPFYHPITGLLQINQINKQGEVASLSGASMSMRVTARRVSMKV